MNPKLESARAALAYVRSGMVLGLGTGSTSAYFLESLAEQLRTGALYGIVGVPSSRDTANRARALGIELTTLDEQPKLDLVVDGADEVDDDLNLIKGLGRALLREKIVAIHADCFVVIVDESKAVSRLGRGPLPVEIVPFGAGAHLRWLRGLGCQAELWREPDGRPVVTDNGNYLVKCWFPKGIADPHALACTLAGRPGIAEHGLFLGMAHVCVMAGATGIRTLRRGD